MKLQSFVATAFRCSGLLSSRFICSRSAAAVDFRPPKVRRRRRIDQARAHGPRTPG